MITEGYTGQLRSLLLINTFAFQQTKLAAL